MAIQVSFTLIDNFTLDTYLKWLSYVPEHWNMDEITNKKIQELTEDEMIIVKQILNDRILIRLIEQYKIEPTFEKHNILSEELRKYSFKERAKMKLTPEEIELFDKKVKKMNIVGLKARKHELSNERDISFKENYELYLIEERLIQEMQSPASINYSQKKYTKMRNNPKNKPRY